MTALAREGGIALSVVVPAYNEEERIGASLGRIVAWLREHEPASEILVVDDGSTDSTPRVAISQDHDPIPLFVLPLAPNRGKGYAVRTGMLAARGDYVLMTDADLSTPIDEAPRLLEPLRRGEYDIAIGSRGLPESRLGVRQPWARERLGRTANLMVRAITGTTILDTQCGFKIFRRDVARRVFCLQRGHGFVFDAEVIFLAEQAGFRVLELPVVWNNALGSKVHPVRDSMRSLLDLLCMRVRDLRGEYRVPAVGAGLVSDPDIHQDHGGEQVPALLRVEVH